MTDSVDREWLTEFCDEHERMRGAVGRERVVEILCTLNALVAREHIGFEDASDCFCKATSHRDATYFQHSGDTLRFIIEATIEKLDRLATMGDGT